MSAISASPGTLAAPVSVTGHPSGAFSRQSSRTYPADCSGASDLAEAGVALFQACCDGFHLVRAADQRADLLLLGREPRRQVGPPGEVEQPLRRPDRVRA